MKEKLVMSWSGGKDSALALREIFRAGKYDVCGLLTTCTEGHDRVSMHGVRCSLLEAQADSLQLPLKKVFIPQQASNVTYDMRMREAFLDFKRQGIARVAFGDLFLEEIRSYRQALTASAGMEAVYPIWGLKTDVLAQGFVRDGFGAVLVCVDLKKLDQSFAGRMLTEELLNQLPPHVDPCGENGEFHSFVYQAPIFRRNVDFRLGHRVVRDSLCFADLLPVG